MNKKDLKKIEYDLLILDLIGKIKRLEKEVAELKIYKADKQTKRTDEDWEQ